jgi:hypothetical protein
VLWRSATTGRRRRALDLARLNLDDFRASDIDAIIVSAAGCGRVLKLRSRFLWNFDEGPVRRQGQGHFRI